MRKNGKLNTTYMVEMALLIAIILIMAFTPIGYIKTFGLEITLIVVPVAVGAVVLGPTAGAILGGVFGLTSFIQCFGMSAFGAMLLSINPAGTFVVCFVTRLVMGWLTGLIAQGIEKGKSIKRSICLYCKPLLSTVEYPVVYDNTDPVLLPDRIYPGTCKNMKVANPFAFVIAFVGVNGLVEAAACFVVGSAITKSITAFRK